MSAPAITPTNALRELLPELQRVRWLLVSRQLWRLLAIGLIWAGAAALIAVMFCFVLPWLLWGSVWAGALPMTVAVAVLAACWAQWLLLRGWHWPSSLDCALALDFGHVGREDALATALALPDDSRFASQVLGRARVETSQRRELLLPPAVRTIHLLLAPLLILAACVAVVFSLRLSPRLAEIQARTSPVASVKPSVIAGSSSSSASDIKAFEDALGLRRLQASLEGLAADLRDDSKGTSSRQASLDKAREAADKIATSAGSSVTLPATVPALVSEREDLAKRVAAAGAAVARSAAALEEGKGAATVDSGGDIKPGSGASVRAMEPFPAYDARRFEDASQALSDQTPQRKALAQGAIEALARIKRGQ